MSIIVTRLTGGLGNQMFQYAAGYALSLRRDVPLELDITSYLEDSLRHFELDVFPELAGTTAGPHTHARIQRKAKGLSKLFTRSMVTPDIPIYRQPHFEFDPAVLDLQPPHTLYGYWQSEKYFADHESEVRQAFAFSAPSETENLAIARDILAQPMPISIHVRRGDYVTDPSASAVHGTCSIEYYRLAMRSMLTREPNAHFFAFSDDTVWTREHLGADIPITCVSANLPSRGVRDMQLMSMCRHHIIANSSFSWWGAWLNPREDKHVIAPARWFAGSNNDTHDLLPPSWQQI